MVLSGSSKAENPALIVGKKDLKHSEKCSTKTIITRKDASAFHHPTNLKPTRSPKHKALRLCLTQTSLRIKVSYALS